MYRNITLCQRRPGCGDTCGPQEARDHPSESARASEVTSPAGQMKSERVRRMPPFAYETVRELEPLKDSTIESVSFAVLLAIVKVEPIPLRKTAAFTSRSVLENR